MQGNATYRRLASSKVEGSKNIVISECSKGGYTLANQIVYVDEKGARFDMFLKGALHVPDMDGLVNLRDAINVAIKNASDTADRKKLK